MRNAGYNKIIRLIFVHFAFSPLNFQNCLSLFANELSALTHKRTLKLYFTEVSPYTWNTPTQRPGRDQIPPDQ